MPKVFRALCFLLLVGLMITAMVGCGGNNTDGGPVTSNGSSSVPANETLITGKLVDVRVSSEGWPWELDVEIYSTQDVAGKQNLLKDSEGQVITARTQQYLQGFTKGQGLTISMALEEGETGNYYIAWDIH